MLPFFQKTDGRHLSSCEARKFLFIILLVMAFLPVQPAQNADTPENSDVNDENLSTFSSDIYNRSYLNKQQIALSSGIRKQ